MDTTITPVPLSMVIAGNNDRTTFDAAKLRELADNIREHGLAQPPTLRPLPDGRYEIVAGERRTRACRLLGWESIPAIVRPMSDEQASAVMLAENTARADLDPVDEARAYDERMRRFGWTPEQVARAAGVSDEAVRAVLPVLKLIPEIQDYVRRGKFTRGYAAILGRANLDANRQRLAFRKWQANPQLGASWFSAECAQLAAEQERETPGASLFDMSAFLLTTADDEALRVQMPPDPRTAKPPVVGTTPREVISNQAAWYDDLAAQWDKLGKPNKRDQALAKSEAIRDMMSTLGLDAYTTDEAAQYLLDAGAFKPGTTLKQAVNNVQFHTRQGKLCGTMRGHSMVYSREALDSFASTPRKAGRQARDEGE